ncbi:SRPBCC family protein [uncultured Williamsia sp.]|uniref:SRPBCC family protein n=1 Tax=uncultured Williamsia sp. TaxID=259311 RepID=UPI002620FBC0|nr:SRPBCC family protein [uncultured Williamsia sp.]
MVQVTRTFTARVAQPAAVAYLRDFANATEWDPGSVSNVQTGDGPVGVGTVWHNTSSFGGAKPELDYTLVRDDPDHVRFEGANSSTDTADDIAVRDLGDGRSEITYTATIRPKGIWRLGAPIFWVLFQRIAGETVSSMTRSLEKL